MNYLKRQIKGFKFLRTVPEHVEPNDIVIVLQEDKTVTKTIPSVAEINWNMIRNILNNDEEYKLAKQLVNGEDIDKINPDVNVKYFMEKLIPLINNSKAQHDLLELWERFGFGNYLGFIEATTSYSTIDTVNTDQFSDMKIVDSQTKDKLSQNDASTFTDCIHSANYMVYNVKKDVVIDQFSNKLINYSPLAAINRNGVKKCPEHYMESSLWKLLEDIPAKHKEFRLIFVSPKVQAESEDWYNEPNIKNAPIVNDGGEIINVAFHFMCVMFYGMYSADSNMSLNDIYSI